jgi:hypothetical protein
MNTRALIGDQDKLLQKARTAEAVAAAAHRLNE